MRQSARVWWLSLLTITSTLLWSVTVLAQESIGTATAVVAVRGTHLVRPQWSENELAAQSLCWHENEGMSLRAIVQRLNAAGVPTRSGRGQWYQASVSELLRQHIPKGEKARMAFLAKYDPGCHVAEDTTAPQPTKRQRTRKATSVA